MACDRFAFSNIGNSTPRRGLRRAPAVSSQLIRLPVMNPAVRERHSRNDALLHDLAVTQLAAAEARIAELEAALREARDIASHDPLTGVLNRRGLQEVFAREKARARRNQQPLAIALIDLDDFKCINDRHGHALGDAALIHLTRVIVQTLRPTDVCSRLGGEEFVLIMPGSELASARKALARLQEALAAQAVPGTVVQLSFSAGVAAVAEGEALEEVLERADRGVYQAKLAGKRRVIST